MSTKPANSPSPPDLRVKQWLNTAHPLTPPELQGKVVLVEAFQMLCPGCVSHALPQTQRAHRLFASSEFVAIGIHTVFEHHQAQGQQAVLAAFVYENGLTFPIAVDAATPNDPIPQTMRLYGLRGTPSLMLFDREGQLVVNRFGAIDDLTLGFTIAMLIARKPLTMSPPQPPASRPATCEANECPTS